MPIFNWNSSDINIIPFAIDKVNRLCYKPIIIRVIPRYSESTKFNTTFLKKIKNENKNFNVDASFICFIANKL